MYVCIEFHLRILYKLWMNEYTLLVFFLPFLLFFLFEKLYIFCAKSSHFFVRFSCVFFCFTSMEYCVEYCTLLVKVLHTSIYFFFFCWCVQEFLFILLLCIQVVKFEWKFLKNDFFYLFLFNEEKVLLCTILYGTCAYGCFFFFFFAAKCLKKLLSLSIKSHLQEII